ncbi:amidohydrolase [Rhodohalobacter barkolensis]|uniref:Amidohydrolase n=1 Tax=Rhodohalobacter barkolensis TaxID=2053187 RepID=A0A2N0VFC0_9BACT|nr:amidohydrolase [Rhodohalobacter barkolensis]PKD42850.1 amidohydrolase [Rhodohalobacter barkolensis]
MSMDLDLLRRVRKELHASPELSGSEEETANRVIHLLKELKPDELITNIGGEGIVARFNAIAEVKKTVLFRAELDAIAVNEETDLSYRSGKNGVMHGCGHDGHMAILLGFAREIGKNRPRKTEVWIMFQPAEETGEGAERMLKDPKFEKVNADEAFALHNLPGFPVNQVVVKEDVFAAASTGVEVKFKGKSSHAAYPEQGVNPASYIAELILFADQEFDEFRSLSSINKIVTTYTQLGERAFGISPGEGNVGFTIRSSSDEELEGAVNKLKSKVQQLQKTFEGKISVDLVEPFSATVNHSEGVKAVVDAAEKSGLEWQKAEAPFPWSEDFGEFRKKFSITLFGLGTGEEHPPLHSEKYDFNDELISAGVKMFINLVE